MDLLYKHWNSMCTLAREEPDALDELNAHYTCHCYDVSENIACVTTALPSIVQLHV